MGYAVRIFYLMCQALLCFALLFASLCIHPCIWPLCFFRIFPSSKAYLDLDIDKDGSIQPEEFAFKDLSRPGFVLGLVLGACCEV